MKIDRNKHAAFLEEELQAQTDEFKQKLNTSAIQLMNRNELFVGLYTKFHPNGEMIMMLPTSRGVPRKNEYYYCLLLPDNLSKYKNWDNRNYKELIEQELCATDLKFVWHRESDTPGFVLAGFNNVSIEFKKILEKNGRRVALTIGPKVPPYEYLSNLHKMVQSNVLHFDSILDSDYNTKQCAPILIGGNTDLRDIADREFQKSDIFTLQGPPGTGKTYRIAQLCKYYCSQGKSVLVTALTNVALMSVAEKNKETSPYSDFTIYKTSLSSDEKAKCPFICQTDDVVSVKGALVLATFYKMSYAALQAGSHPAFDYVIVDEASQAFIATLAAAKRLGKKAIWVGDINQMPPISLLSENRIKKEGYIHLIEGLKTVVQSFPYALFQLTTTYRLGPRGAQFTGIFYNNTLQSAAPDTLFDANTIDGPIIIKMPLPIGDSTPRSAIDKAITIIQKHIHTKNKEIAVLSHRIDTVLSILRRVAEEELNNNILIDTVARVQGMTKDIVIYVIPNTDCMLYSLEKRLFNVATSRARKNTYIIIDNNYPSYPYIDSSVLKYLQSAEISF